MDQDGMLLGRTMMGSVMRGQRSNLMGARYECAAYVSTRVLLFRRFSSEEQCGATNVYSCFAYPVFYPSSIKSRHCMLIVCELAFVPLGSSQHLSLCGSRKYVRKPFFACGRPMIFPRSLTTKDSA